MEISKPRMAPENSAALARMATELVAEMSPSIAPSTTTAWPRVGDDLGARRTR